MNVLMVRSKVLEYNFFTEIDPSFDKPIPIKIALLQPPSNYYKLNIDDF